MITRRASVITLITIVIMTTLIGMAVPAHADGGDFTLDFVAAGPFTYDHDTGAGGEFADRTISKTDGVVESLEGGDFECGDKVVYFTQIVVDGGASGEQDIEIDYGFLAEPTGAPGVGMTDLVSVAPNTGDSGMSGDTGDTTATIESEGIDTSGPKDELTATVGVQNLDPGETFILRLVVLLSCIPGSSPTGNLQGEIHAARVVSPTEDAISAGNQTIPFKSVADVLKDGSVSVAVGECPAPGSPTRPVTVTIDPSGSAVVTILGPGGPYVVTGAGDTLDLAPGDYSWTAVAEPGFLLTGDTSGEFTVGSCPRLPASVEVSVGQCPGPGSPTVPVTVTIDPSGSATVTITGPGGPYVVTGDGDTLDLAPGDYSWTAEPDDEFSLEIDSGGFTVPECPRLPASVQVTVGDCPAPGSATRPVTIVIEPPGSATVTIDGPGGPYVVTGAGDTLDLAPGDYTWEAEADPEHVLEVARGSFTVEACPAIASSVTVTVGACPPVSSTTRPVTVAISPDGAASVTITGPNGFNQVVAGSGATLDLAAGSYAWTATANPTFEIIGASEGTFDVGSCVVEVLPREFLPRTGASLPGLGTAGLGLVLLGLVMVVLSRRPVGLAWAGSSLVEHLRGRSTWTPPEATGRRVAWTIHPADPWDRLVRARGRRHGIG